MKNWKLLAEEYKKIDDNSFIYSRLCSRPLTIKEKERNKINDAESKQRIEINQYNYNLFKKVELHTDKEKLEFLRKKSKKYNHKYPSLNPDYPHPCMECFYYRFYYDFGFLYIIDGKYSSGSYKIEFADDVKIVGNKIHICDFNVSMEIGIRNICRYYDLRNMVTFEKYYNEYLNWMGDGYRYNEYSNSYINYFEKCIKELLDYSIIENIDKE
ncbi:MAG: hypothetical protein ACFFG0_49695 [Candidatus Thorarchaeota archaeon]